jgi:hypothetical protein
MIRRRRMISKMAATMMIAKRMTYSAKRALAVMTRMQSNSKWRTRRQSRVRLVA